MSATILEFPMVRRALQIAAENEAVDARLADVLRPLTVRPVDTDPEPPTAA
jgi:hypothetical protein